MLDRCTLSHIYEKPATTRQIFENHAEFNIYYEMAYETIS